MATTQLSIRVAIHALVERKPLAASDLLTDELLRSVPKATTLAAFVRPLLQQAIEHAQRERVSAAELAAARASWRPVPSHRKLVHPDPSGAALPFDVLKFRDGLRDQFFKLNGARVRWWDATIEQLRERRAFFLRHIAGCEATLALLDQAIAALETTGAATLADLREAAA